MPPPHVHLNLSDPSAWVLRYAALVPPGGTALDVACGGGRHARALLERGHAVTLIDADTAYVADLTDRAEVVTADLEDGSPWPMTGRTFGAVVVTNYLYRPLFPYLTAAVAEGGVLIYETFARGNEQFGRPRNPSHLLEPGELLTAFPGLQVVAYEAGIEGGRCGRKVIERICCVKTPEPVELPGL
ncbi:MAG: class I SAM-dependent methyltransferase [Rhodospirillaceae bacterium]